MKPSRSQTLRLIVAPSFIYQQQASEKTLDIVSDQLLIAAGRVPNSDTLDLDKTGVKINDRGYIVTDRYLETNVKGYLQLEM